MGKGDKKTKRGKIIKGSFGVKRPKKLKNKLTTMGVEKEKVVKKPSKPKAIKDQPKAEEVIETIKKTEVVVEEKKEVKAEPKTEKKVKEKVEEKAEKKTEVKEKPKAKPKAKATVKKEDLLNQ